MVRPSSLRQNAATSAPASGLTTRHIHDAWGRKSGWPGSPAPAFAKPAKPLSPRSDGRYAPFAATQDTYEHLADYLEKTDVFTEEELADIYYNNAKEVYFS